jgi:DNA polymerase
MKLKPKPREQKTRLHLDFETKCDLDLKQVGLDLYTAHPSFEILLCSWAVDDDSVQLWDATEEEMPQQLYDLLMDDDVELHAFNAQFERISLARALGIIPRITRWRCTMVSAFMRSFSGDLAAIGEQIGIDQDKQKLAEGKRLIRLFTMPQKITKNQAFKWRDSLTDPDDWERFKEYCVMDTIAEREIFYFLDQPQFAVPDREWKFYALDQVINDRGLPINRAFADKAYKMATRRKAILIDRMNRITGLANSNSGDQLTPWLQDRGYPYDDLRKDTVKKVLSVDQARKDGDKVSKDELTFALTDDAVTILKMRQKSARTTHTKYLALLKAMGADDRMRFVFQFAGAARTSRFAGRRFQPQNLTSLHELADFPDVLAILNAAIEEEDDEFLEVLMTEPL